MSAISTRQAVVDRRRIGEEPGDQGAARSGPDRRRCRFCRDQGVIVGRPGGGRRFGTTIALCPPLVITRAECDRIVETLGRALQALVIDYLRSVNRPETEHFSASP